MSAFGWKPKIKMDFWLDGCICGKCQWTSPPPLPWRHVRRHIRVHTHTWAHMQRFTHTEWTHPGICDFELSEDVLRHVVLSHRIHHKVLVPGWPLCWPVLMTLLLQEKKRRKKLSALKFKQPFSIRGKMTAPICYWYVFRTGYCTSLIIWSHENGSAYKRKSW